MRDCDSLLAAVARGELLAPTERMHVTSCPHCSALAPALGTIGAALAATAAPAPPAGLSERVLHTAAPLLHRYARVSIPRTPHFDGKRLAKALLPAILLFPVLVLVDALLLRSAHELLGTLLPRPLTTYLVVSYAAALAALVCLTFGAIPLLVQRQAGMAPWKEGHV